MLPSATAPETYGLPLEDYLPVENPETDLAAAKYEAIAVDVSGLTHVSPRAWAKVTVSGGAATLDSHDAVWGSATAVAPTVTYDGTGIVSVEWPATAYDLNPTPARSVSRAVSIRAATVQVNALTGAYGVSAVANAVTARKITCTFRRSSTDAAFDPDSFTVFAW